MRVLPRHPDLPATCRHDRLNRYCPRSYLGSCNVDVLADPVRVLAHLGSVFRQRRPDRGDVGEIRPEHGTWLASELDDTITVADILLRRRSHAQNTVSLSVTM